MEPPPTRTRYPTGGDWAEQYLQPLADARRGPVRRAGSPAWPAPGATWSSTPAATTTSFAVHVETPDGARGDAAPVRSSTPPAPGRPPTRSARTATPRRRGRARRPHRLPRPRPRDPAVRARYAGKHVAVAGTGASAQRLLVDLAELAGRRRRAPGWVAPAPSEPRRHVRWGRRRPARRPRRPGPARQGRAGSDVVTTRTGFRTDRRRGRRQPPRRGRDDGQRVERVDEIVVSPGSAPTSPSSPRCGSTSTCPPGADASWPPLIDPERPLLRHRLPARHRRARPPRAGLVPGRHEVLRPRPDLPRHDRLRAGPLGRRGAGR